MSVVISLFDYSTVMVKPWADAGYKCYCIDIQHPSGETVEGNIHKIGINIHDFVLPNESVKIMFGFPPCTHLASSGARWFKGKGLRKLADAILLFAKASELCEESNAPYFLENPVSTISTYWRKPDYTFEPWHYGDNYTKKTCLWTGNNFIMPIGNFIKPFDLDVKKIHYASESPERANIRSATPEGFAKAVFEANNGT